MILAKYLNNLFKKGGFELIDANSKKHVIGNPKELNHHHLIIDTFC